MKIAIIGGGVSGLTVAHLLHDEHDLTLFEANDYVGGHTHTHELEAEGRRWRVDSGFIVYNEKTYPNFIKLLRKLKVVSQKSSMGFSVKAPNKKLEYSGASLNALFAQRQNLFRLSFYVMIKDILRFNRVAKSKLEGLVESMTINEFLKQNKFSKHFVENYIIPMGAAIWSTAAEKTIEMPAVFYIRFFKNHGLLQTKNRPQWRVIKGGSKSYIEKIKAGFEKQIKLSTPVKKIIRYKDEVEIFFGKSGEYSNKFDKVIIATHSDQALQMLEEPSAKEKEILGSLPYQENEALLHTDESILPRKKQTWSSWNYLLNEDSKGPVALTYSMNILQSLTARTQFLVTLNSSENIDSNKILKKLIYQHPLFTVEGVRLQKEKHLINGKKNTFYCGAYWGNGFHEDGVVSALDVCKFFGKVL